MKSKLFSQYIVIASTHLVGGTGKPSLMPPLLVAIEQGLSQWTLAQSIPNLHAVILVINFQYLISPRNWAKRFTYGIPLKAHCIPMLVMIFPIFKDEKWRSHGRATVHSGWLDAEIHHISITNRSGGHTTRWMRAGRQTRSTGLEHFQEGSLGDGADRNPVTVL